MDSHAANHPDIEHLTADVTGYPMRFLPRALLLWASIICTEVSPAGGRVHPTDQLDLFQVLDQLDDDEAEEWEALTPEAFERTRATAWCVVRACEAKRFPYVVIENVVEFVESWVNFKDMVKALKSQGYEAPQILSVSSAHVGDDTNLRAPRPPRLLRPRWRAQLPAPPTVAGRCLQPLPSQGHAQAGLGAAPPGVLLRLRQGRPREEGVVRPQSQGGQVPARLQLPVPQQ